MNRRDELRERYEDALFAFLMEDVIETEGKKMLEENERLKQDPLAAVPEAVDYRCIQTIKRGFAKERRHTRRQNCLSGAKQGCNDRSHVRIAICYSVRSQFGNSLKDY